MNNMGREIMAALKRFQVGSDGDGVTVGGSLVVSGSTTANTFSATNVTASGNLTFTGTGNRITGDFSNATVANRVGFQSSTTNGVTDIPIIPNGTGANARHFYYSASDTTNASLLTAGVVGAEATFRASAVGSGTSPTMTFYTGGSERMRIGTTGNVGIGTNSPQVSLQVNKASDPSVRIFETGSSVDTRLTSLTTAGIVGTYSNHPFVVYTNTAERMRIDSSGNWMLGRTSTQNGNTFASIENGSSSLNGLWIQQSNAAETTSCLVITTARNTSLDTSNFFIDCGTNWPTSYVRQFAVRKDGTIFATNTTVQSLSDIRTKENVRDSEDGLAVVSALRPVRFDFKEGFGNDKKNQLGFVAQEVEPVFPDAVSEWEQDGETYKSVGPGALIPVLVKAIQELKAELDTVKAELATLKGN
jgi:hypothetical protein